MSYLGLQVNDMRAVGFGNEQFASRLSSLVSLLMLAAVAVLVSGCQRSPEQLKFSGPTMGTSYNVTVVPGDVNVPDNLDQVIVRALNRVNDQMSTYMADSQISELNNLPAGNALAVAPEFAEVMAISQRVFSETGGAFEPTVGPLVDLWGFGPVVNSDQIPAAERIEQARRAVDFAQLAIEGNRVHKRAAVRLDLSAVAKGYAADLVSRELRALGLSNYLVEVGGEMRLAGTKHNGSRWRVGIEQPQLGRGAVQLAVAVTDAGVATSGDYRNYFERDGVRYSHTIDPRTGYPVTHKLASVTVIADNAARADALATAFMVMGAEASLALAEQLDLAVYLLVREGDDFAARYSTCFQKFLP